VAADLQTATPFTSGAAFSASVAASTSASGPSTASAKAASVSRKPAVQAPVPRESLLATSRRACPSMSWEEKSPPHLQIPSDLAEGTGLKPLGRKVTTHSSAASGLALGESSTGAFPPREPVPIPADAWQA
jgi:hypothetical protein